MLTRPAYYLIASFLLASTIVVSAQSTRLYSQYMFNGLAINPAYAGNQYDLTATALHRAQWTGIEGAPVSQTLTVQKGFKSRKVGLGLIVDNYKIGVTSAKSVFASYAYHISGDGFNISMGLQGGFESVRSDYTELYLNKPNDPKLSGSVNQLTPNFGAGIFVYNAHTYVGLSVPSFIQTNRLDLSDYNSNTISKVRTYMLTAGRVFETSPLFKVKPSFLVRYQEGSPLTVDVNATVIYNSILFAGVSYRSSRSIVGLLQFQVSENLRVGYAYDYGINSISQYAGGSHELMITFRTNLIHQKCPAYF